MLINDRYHHHGDHHADHHGDHHGDDNDDHDDFYKMLILKEITRGSGVGWGHIIKKILGSDIVINVWGGTLD